MPVTAWKSSTVRFIIYAQEESTEAKAVDKQKHEKTRKRQEYNNYMLTTLFQHDNQLININWKYYNLKIIVEKHLERVDNL